MQSELSPLINQQQQQQSQHQQPSSEGTPQQEPRDVEDQLPIAKKASKALKNRVIALDQYRGYTMLAMLFVNLCYSQDNIPDNFHAGYTYTAWHDTVEPGFMFCAGFAYRLVFLRNLKAFGWRGAVYRVFWIRVAALLIISFCLEGFGPWAGLGWKTMSHLSFRDFWLHWFAQGPWQTLTHIATSMIWLIPVVSLGRLPRLAHMLLSIILKVTFVIQIYHHGPSDWKNSFLGQSGADSGPTGFLNHSLAMMLGTFAHDICLGEGIVDLLWLKKLFHLVTFNKFLYDEYQNAATFHKALRGFALFLCGFGWALLAYFLTCFGSFAHFDYCCDIDVMRQTRQCVPISCHQPFWAENPFKMYGRDPFTVWTTSNMFGSVTYSLICGGINMTGLSLMYLYNDVLQYPKIALLDTFGANSLVAYVLAQSAGNAVQSTIPQDAPAALFFCVAVPWYFWWAYMIQRYFEINAIYIAI